MDKSKWLIMFILSFWLIAFMLGFFTHSSIDCPGTKYIVQPCECEENLMTAESCNQLDDLIIERYDEQKERWNMENQKLVDEDLEFIGCWIDDKGIPHCPAYKNKKTGDIILPQ